MKTPRFAFVGSTHEVHPWLPAALQRVGRIEAFCGPDAALAVERHHARWAYHDLEEMMRESEPDAVVVGLPVRERAAVIRACLAHRVHVLVPGVPGRARECRRINTLAQLAARVALAATPTRYAPAILLARRLIESGRTARPVSLVLTSSWRVAAVAEAPVALDQLYDALELVHSLLGSFHRMQAIGHPEGVLSAQGEASNNVVTTLLLHARSTAEAAGLELEIRAGDGTRLHLNREGRLICGNGSRLDAFHGPSRASADPVTESGCLGLVNEFARLIRVGGGGMARHVEATVRLSEQLLRQAARGSIGQEGTAAIDSACTARNSVSVEPL